MGRIFPGVIRLLMPDSSAPELEDVIESFVERGIARLHAAIPAVVTVYDPATQRAQCQPVLLKRIVEPATGVEIPSPNPSPSTPFLPVQWPSGGRAGGPASPPTWGLTGPLNPGDPVTLLVRSRSCDEWQSAGVPVVFPTDPRSWAIQDAVVLPGHAALTGALPATAVDPVSMVLFGTPASPVKLGTNIAVDGVLKGTAFLAALKVWLDVVAVATTTVGTAPQNAAALAAIRIATTALLSSIGTPGASPLESLTAKVSA